MELITYPNELLRKKSDDVLEVTDDVRKMLFQMHEIMIRNRGIGLAAPQVGLLRNMVVIDLREGKRPWYFINPVLESFSREQEICKEGCLSIPNVFGNVIRPKKVNVRFIDLNGEQKEMLCSGMMARVIQHEVDHLNGIMHIDKLMEKYSRRMR